MKKVLPRISVTKIGELYPKEDNEEYVGFKSLSDADVIKNKKYFDRVQGSTQNKQNLTLFDLNF